MNYTTNSLDIKKDKNNRLSRDIEVANNKHIHSNNRP